MPTAATYYVQTTGSNTNSGSSASDSPIVNGSTMLACDADTTIDFNSELDLSGVSVGDTIRIDTATGGRGSGGELFRINAVDDVNNTVDVDEACTCDANENWWIGGAFATIDAAMNAVEAGDTVYVKEGTYTDPAEIDTIGAVGSPILFEAYTASGSPGDWDEDTSPLVIMDGEDSDAAMIVDTLGNNVYARYVFRGFDFRRATGNGVSCDGVHAILFDGCRFADNGNDGCVCRGYSRWVDCEFDGNARYDIYDSGYNIDNLVLGCEFKDSGNHSINITGGAVSKCVFRNPGATCVQWKSAGIYMQFVEDCSVYGAKHIGVDFNFNNCMAATVVNSAFYDCDPGIDSTTYEAATQIARHNIFASCDSDRNNFVSSTGDVSVSEDPFQDGANGDFSLIPGSRALDSGYPDNADIGARQRKRDVGVGRGSMKGVG